MQFNHTLEGYSIYMNKGDKSDNKQMKPYITKAYHSESCTHCFGRQILSELCSHYSTVSVWPGNTPPNNSEFARLLVASLLRLLVDFVNVHYTFPQIKVRFLPFRHTFDF